MQFELNPFFLCLLLGGASIAHISIIYIMLFKLDEKRTKMKLNWTIGFFLDRLIYVFYGFVLSAHIVGFLMFNWKDVWSTHTFTQTFVMTEAT